MCLPHGLPQADLMSYAPFKIVQTPTVIALLYELDNNFRQIDVDGRSLPKDLNPTWGGYSVGKREGDTRPRFPVVLLAGQCAVSRQQRVW